MIFWSPFENHYKMKWLPSINKAFIIIIIIIIIIIYVIATAIGWTIPRGSTEIAEHIVQRYSNRYNHSAAPKHVIWVNIASFLYAV